MPRHLAFSFLCLLLATVRANSAEVQSQTEVILQGYVRDTNGQGVVEADLDFDDAQTGERLPVIGDKTGTGGFYRAILPAAGFYHISYSPPPGTRLIGQRFLNLQVSAPGKLFDVALPFGLVVSGSVRDSATGAPVENADLDVDDLSTGQRLFTPGDKSDASGFYRIVIPSGHYRIRFDAPESTHFRAVRLDSVPVLRDTSLDAALPAGPAVHGRVVNRFGQGVRDVKLDFEVKATGQNVLVSNRRTGPAGNFWVTAPPGIYEVQFEPPLPSRLRGRKMDSLLVNADVALPDIQLDSGILVTGTVRDSTNGQATANVSIEALDYQTNRKVFVAEDKSDTGGFYGIVVPPGRLRLRFNPPVATRLRGVQLDTISASRDTIINVSLASGLVLSGQVVDSSGRGIKGISVELEDAATGREIFLANSRTDSSGFFQTVAPAGLFDLFFSPLQGQRWVAARERDVALNADTTLYQVLDSGALLTVAVTDSLDRPLQGVDLNVFLESTGRTVFIPHDNTDAAGTVEAALLPDSSYRLVFALFTGRTFDSLALSGVRITRDTSFSVKLPAAAYELTGRVEDSAGRGIPDVIIEFQEATSLQKVPVLNNRTDGAGAFRVVVFANTYNIAFAPQPGGGFDSLVLPGVTIEQDTSFSVVLPGRPSRPPAPAETRILEARPNPFRPGLDAETKFPIDLNSVSGDWSAALVVFSSAGEIVYRYEGQFPGGSRNVITWDGTNSKGEKVGSGVYFCKVVLEKPGDSKRIEKVLKVAVIR